MKVPMEEEPERPFAQMLWSLRRLGWPLLPLNARLARMQEAIDREAARKTPRVFGFEGVTVTGLGSVPLGCLSLSGMCRPAPASARDSGPAGGFGFQVLLSGSGRASRPTG